MKKSGKKRTGILFIAAALVSFAIAAPTVAMAGDIKAELVKLETRSGVVQPFIYYAPEKPMASMILFNGGFGEIEAKSFFGRPGVGKSAKNFLVKNRMLFAEQGMAVAVLDIPSDVKKKSEPKNRGGMGLDFRISVEHMTDIAAVIDFLRKAHPDLPIFLAGQSLGTVSVAAAAIKLGDKIDGIVLASSATKPKASWKEKWPVFEKYPNAILDFEGLSQVTIPVLVLAHTQDTCVPTPPDRAQSLRDAFAGSSDVELLLYDKGSAKEKGCSYVGYHSFYGIQDEAVSDITSFVKKQVTSPAARKN